MLRGFVGYVLLAIVAIPSRRHEIFPFFCWFLFPVAPNVTEHYVLQLREISGVRLPQAVRFADAVTHVAEPHSMDAYVAVQALGQAISNADAEGSQRSWRILESNFLSAPCEVELLKVTSDPLETWRGEPPRSAESIRVLACAGPQTALGVRP